MRVMKKFSSFINENLPADNELELLSQQADGGDEDAFNKLQDAAQVEPQNLEDIKKVNKANQSIKDSKVLYEGAVKNLMFEITEILENLVSKVLPNEFNIDLTQMDLQPYAQQIFELCTSKITENLDEDSVQGELTGLEGALANVWDVMKVEVLELIEKGEIEDHYKAEEWVNQETDIGKYVWDDKDIENKFKEMEGFPIDESASLMNEIDDNIKSSLRKFIETIEHWHPYQDDDEVGLAIQSMKEATEPGSKFPVEDINRAIEDIERWQGEAYQSDDEVGLALEELKQSIASEISHFVDNLDENLDEDVKNLFLVRGYDDFGRTPEDEDFMNESFTINPKSDLMRKINENVTDENSLREYLSGLPELLDYTEDIMDALPLIKNITNEDEA